MDKIRPDASHPPISSAAYCRSAGAAGDRVAPFEGKLAQQQIEKAMGLPVETWV
ncbi:hypothetical protein MJ584_01630 [Klebsiella pneumoniae]|nr:hypothetical protein MJ584_01630 [Klebsiella pneumoniae]